MLGVSPLKCADALVYIVRRGRQFGGVQGKPLASYHMHSQRCGTCAVVKNNPVYECQLVAQ